VQAVFSSRSSPVALHFLVGCASMADLFFAEQGLLTGFKATSNQGHESELRVAKPSARIMGLKLATIQTFSAGIGRVFPIFFHFFSCQISGVFTIVTFVIRCTR
jgi:hypothetical protein